MDGIGLRMSGGIMLIHRFLAEGGGRFLSQIWLSALNVAILVKMIYEIKG
jgi:hypothetical protein